MYKAATIKDIAHALNLSASTISRALSDSHEIGMATKARVLAYAKQINYHYNPIAQSLRMRKSCSIGVMVADVANSFFSQTINGIESVAYEKGYHVIISQSHDSYEREVLNIAHLASRSVDGLLISMSAQTTDYEHIKKLHDNGMPIIFFDRILDEIDTFKVTTDNYTAAYQATELLIKNGHKKIAHLASAPQLSITIDRANGHKAALKHYNLSVDEELFRYCYDGGRNPIEVTEALHYFLSADNKPDALFIASDRLTSASMRVLNDMADKTAIAIIGFSNSDMIDLLSPKISYVRQPAFEMGQMAVKKLINLIESKHPVYEYDTQYLNADIRWLS